MALASMKWRRLCVRLMPPVGADAAHYGARPLGVFAWGQAPALLALLA